MNWTSGTGEGVANRMVGGMAEVTITKNDHGEVEIADYGVKPMISHVASGPEGVTTYFLRIMTRHWQRKMQSFRRIPIFPENTVSICVIPYGEICGRQSRQAALSLLK